MSECLWNPIDFHPRLKLDWFALFLQFDFFLPNFSTIACSFFLAAAQTSFSSHHLGVRLLFRRSTYPRASFKFQPGWRGDLFCQKWFPFFSFLLFLHIKIQDPMKDIFQAKQGKSLLHKTNARDFIENNNALPSCNSIKNTRTGVMECIKLSLVVLRDSGTRERLTTKIIQSGD